MIDEREHRRGLILGLTLAELLLLLLFLLILALGSRIIAQQRLADDFKAKWKDEQVQNDSLRSKILEQTKTNKQLEARLAAATLETASLPVSSQTLNASSKEGTLRKILNDPDKRENLSRAVEVAAKFNAEDPPTILARATETLRELAADESQLAALSSAIEKAARMDPNNAPAVIGKALDKLDKTYTLEPKSCSSGHDWPPIITLSEADGHFFETGSAALSPGFKATISNSIVSRLEKIMAEYDVNVIEVIGHTDEQPINGRTSNLDQSLIPFLRGQIEIDKVLTADNAGLGFARAASVVRLLRSEPRLGNVRVLPYSGAQVIGVDDVMSQGNYTSSIEERRRIEIRVRKSEKEPSPLPTNGAQEVDARATPQKKEATRTKERPSKTAPANPVEWFTTIFAQ